MKKLVFVLVLLVASVVYANNKQYYQQRIYACGQYDAWCVGSVLLDAIFDRPQYPEPGPTYPVVEVRFYGAGSHHPSYNYCGQEKNQRGELLRVLNMIRGDLKGNLQKCANSPEISAKSILAVEFDRHCLSPKSYFRYSCEEVARALQ